MRICKSAYITCIAVLSAVLLISLFLKESNSKVEAELNSKFYASADLQKIISVTVTTGTESTKNENAPDKHQVRATHGIINLATAFNPAVLHLFLVKQELKIPRTVLYQSISDTGTIFFREILFTVIIASNAP